VTVPYAGASGNVGLFVICFLVIVSMYGGGFSTVPAYLRDMFGTRYVGAIHGILLTAWSAAGIAGPVLINYIREYNVTHGVPKAQASTPPCTSWPGCSWLDPANLRVSGRQAPPHETRSGCGFRANRTRPRVRRQSWRRHHT
jgi:hypothetical protein